ncbi:hypothetical protein TMatcc_008464 [Talaromyces marneffei ATCC 18224]
MFDVLVAAGADWKSPDIDWGGFIYSAATEGKYTTVRLLLTHCNIKISERDDTNPLPDVIEEGHKGIARLLIENDPALVNQADKKGITPIGAAIHYGSSLVAELLAAGANLTDRDLDIDSYSGGDSDSGSDGSGGNEKLRLAIVNAVAEQDMDEVHALMDVGGCEKRRHIRINRASPNEVYGEISGTGSGQTLWTMSLYRLPPELFTMIMDYLNFNDIMRIGEDPDFPFELLHRRHLVGYNSILNVVVRREWLFPSAIKKISQLLEIGIPLLSALEKPHYDFCDLFLEAGARVNFCETTSISEDTMRHFMSSIEDTTINRFRDLADSRRRGSMRLASTPLAPLHIAVTKGNVELVELFLRHGADPNLHAELFGTALHFTKDIGIAKLLVANGADVNARNGLGASPLFIALDRGKKDLFTMLIEAGANVDLVADNDDTLLNLAIKRRAGTFVELLLDADCKIEGYGSVIPPLHQAAKHG